MHYSPKFKEKALHIGGKVGNVVVVSGIILTFRAIYRLKSDAQEAKKFYQSVHSHVRIIKKKDGYWVYAGRK